VANTRRRQITARFEACVYPVRLIVVAEREGCPRFKFAQERAGSIGRAVVDDHHSKPRKVWASKLSKRRSKVWRRLNVGVKRVNSIVNCYRRISLSG